MKKIIIILCLIFPILSCSKSDQDIVDSCKEQAKPSVCMDKLAKANNKIAQNELGFMYAKGQGVKQDYKKALYWFTKSAKQGYAKAQLIVGVEMEKKKDYKQAVYWYTKSANQGDAHAQAHLGIEYALGMGVETSIITGYAWASISADDGNDFGIKVQKKIKEEMSSDQINQAKDMAKELLKNIKKP